MGTSDAGSEPSFDGLPVLAATGLRHAWSAFGGGDETGTLNRLTPDVVLQAMQCAVSGARVSLSLPLNLPDPPLFGRKPYEHTMFASSRNTMDDRIDGFYPQASTQWDGLRHVRAAADGFWGGWLEEPTTPDTRLGVQRWSSGVIGRGVLADLGRWRSSRAGNYDPMSNECFSVRDVQDALGEQGTTLARGDVLCLRLGWVDAYLAADEQRRHTLAELSTDLSRRSWAGLENSEDMARFLWDSGVAVVAADNPAVEAVPGLAGQTSLHRRLIPCLGFVLGELFDFSELAERCRERGRYDFLFVSVPWNLPAGVGSPAAAVGIL
jgi:hypothetical protein